MRKAAKALAVTTLLAGAAVIVIAAFTEPTVLARGFYPRTSTAELDPRVKPEAPAAVERYGMVIGLKPEKAAYYKQLHAAAWPGVLKKIKECNIRNYSIYLKEVEPGKIYLFSYFEYAGRDFAADMAKMAADPLTQKWWKETDPCQIAVSLRGDKEWWSRMAEVFHTD